MRRGRPGIPGERSDSGVWVEEDLDGDKTYERVVADFTALFLYSAADIRAGLRAVARDQLGVDKLVRQMASIQTEKIGADAQLLAYPLLIGDDKFYFGFQSRRWGVERLEQLREEIDQIKKGRRLTEQMEQDRKLLGRRGQRRQAVVATSTGPDHNKMLLQLLRAPLARPPSSSTAPPNSSGGSTPAASSDSESDGEPRSSRATTPKMAAVHRIGAPDVCGPVAIAHTGLNASRAFQTLGAFQVLRRLAIRATLASNSKPCGYLSAGAVVQLLESADHPRPPVGSKLGGEEGAMGCQLPKAWAVQMACNSYRAAAQVTSACRREQA